jgi:hypothetical protein
MLRACHYQRTGYPHDILWLPSRLIHRYVTPEKERFLLNNIKVCPWYIHFKHLIQLFKRQTLDFSVRTDSTPTCIYRRTQEFVFRAKEREEQKQKKVEKKR